MGEEGDGGMGRQGDKERGGRGRGVDNIELLTPNWSLVTAHWSLY